MILRESSSSSCTLRDPHYLFTVETYVISSGDETTDKQWKTESEDVFKIQQQRFLIQNPATESEDVFKIQQQRCLIQNPAREREDVFKIQQER